MESVPVLAPDVGLDGVEIRVTMRSGGVSQAPYDSLNLGDHVGDLSHCVAENRRRVSTLCDGFPRHSAIDPQHGLLN